MDLGCLFARRFGRIRSRPCLGEQRGCGLMMCIARRSREDSLALAGKAGRCKWRLLLMVSRILARGEALGQKRSR